MGVMDEAERFEPATLADWSAWLAAHHADTRGVWLVTPRRSVDAPFGYDDAVCEALRYGWIDAVVKTLDEQRSMQWFTPRRPGSGWSRPNKVRIERLEREGRLEASGRAVIDAAKADGTWTLLDEVEDLVVPADLAVAFDAHPGSRATWEGFSASARKAMLAWIVTAKQDSTRARRVEQVAARAAAGEKAYG